MGLVPAGARVSRPPVLGVGRPSREGVPACESTPWSQHSTMPLYGHQYRAYSLYLGLCSTRRKTLGLMAWKCLHGTMTLCEQLWRKTSFRAVFHLLLLDPRAAHPTREAQKTPYNQKHLCHPGDNSKYQTLCAFALGTARTCGTL